MQSSVQYDLAGHPLNSYVWILFDDVLATEACFGGWY